MKNVTVRQSSLHQAQQPAFVSVGHAGRLLKVSRTTMYSLMSYRGGPIQTVKIGKSRKVVWQSLKDYLESLMAEAVEVEKGLIVRQTMEFSPDDAVTPELRICPPCWDGRNVDTDTHHCADHTCHCPCRQPESPPQGYEAYETFLRREAEGLYSDDRDTMIDMLCSMLDAHVWTYTDWCESLGKPMNTGDRRLDGINSR